MINKIKQIVKSVLQKEKTQENEETYEHTIDRIEKEVVYPESEKYFEAAKILLEKYPPEEWEIENSLFPDTKRLKHKNCPIDFGVLLNQLNPSSSLAYFVGDSCEMSTEHGKIIFSLFRPLFDKYNAKRKREQEQIKQQFDEQLAVALS